jgi:hypothetical protein
MSHKELMAFFFISSEAATTGLSNFFYFFADSSCTLNLNTLTLSTDLVDKSIPTNLMSLKIKELKYS